MICLLGISLASCRTGNAGFSQTENLPVTLSNTSLPPLHLNEEHILFPIAQWLERSECTEVVSASEIVWLHVSGEVEEATHSEASQSADSMRSLLSRFVYIETPVLEVGEARFLMTSWWFVGWVSCLVQLEEYERAIALLEYRLMDAFMEEIAYLLVVTRYRFEGEESARSVLQWWAEINGSSELVTSLLNRIELGQTLPLTIQQQPLGLQ